MRTSFIALLSFSVLMTPSAVRAQQFQIDSGQIQGAVQGMLMQSMFNITDTNHDGKVSRQEAIDTAAKRFDEADTNHDGFMTKEEMQAAANHQKPRRQSQNTQNSLMPLLNGVMGSQNPEARTPGARTPVAAPVAPVTRQDLPPSQTR